jgi:hypothetical protein
MYTKILCCLLLFLINQYAYSQASLEELTKAQKNLNEVQKLYSKEHVKYAKAALDLALLYYQDEDAQDKGDELAYEALDIARKKGGFEGSLYLDLLSQLPKSKSLIIDAEMDLAAAKASHGSKSVLYAEKLIKLSKFSIENDDYYAYSYSYAIEAYQVLSKIPLEIAKPVYDYANKSLPAEVIQILEQEIRLERARSKNNSIELADALVAYSSLGLKYQDHRLIYIYIETCYTYLKAALQIYKDKLGKDHLKYQKAYATLTKEMQDFYPIEKDILDRIKNHETANDSFIVDFRKYLRIVDTILILDYGVEASFQLVFADLKGQQGGTNSKYYTIIKAIYDAWDLDESEQNFTIQENITRQVLAEFGVSKKYVVEFIKETNLTVFFSEKEIIQRYKRAFEILDSIEFKLPFDTEEEPFFENYVQQVVQPYRMFLIQEHNLEVKKTTYGINSDVYLSAAFQASWYYLKDDDFMSIGRNLLLNSLQLLKDDNIYLAEQWLDSLLLDDPDYTAHIIKPVITKIFPLVSLKQLLKAPLEQTAKENGKNSLEYANLSELIADCYFFSKNNPKYAKEAARLYKELLVFYNIKEGKTLNYEDLLKRITKNIVADNPWSVDVSTFFFEELLQIYKQYDSNKMDYIYYLKDYADWHYDNDRIISSESYYKTFIKLYWTTPYDKNKIIDYIEASYNLARIYRKTGRPNKASTIYNEILKLSQTTDQFVYYVKCLDDLGLIAYEKDELEFALKRFKEALKTAEKYSLFEDRYNNFKMALLYVKIKRHIARVHLDNGYIAEAEKHYNFIKEFEREENSPVSVRKDISLQYDLAYLAEIQGDSLKAIGYYKAALRVKDQGELAKATIKFANFYQQQEKDSLAAIYLNDALAIDLSRIEESYNSLAEKERLLFLNPISERLNAFFNFALSKQDSALTVTALNAHLTVKGLALETSTNLQSICNETENVTLKNKCSEMQLLRETLAKSASLAAKEQEKISTQIVDLEKDIIVFSKDLRKILGKNNKKLDFYQLKQILKAVETKDSAAIAIDFLIVDQVDESGYESSVYYAAIVGSDFKMPIFVRLTTEEDLQDVLAPDIAPNTINYITDEFESRYLYELIWEPLLPYLSDAKRLHICPSGILNKVAFGTLRTSDYRQGRIMDDYSIHYYSSLRDLLNPQVGTLSEGSTSVGLVGGVKFTLSKKETQYLATQNKVTELDLQNAVKNQAAAEGNWAYSRGARREGFSYLPGTLEEVNAISTIFPDNWVVKLLSDTLATEENLERMTDNSPTILHIATHGYFFPTPSNENDDDAWLYSKKSATLEDNISSSPNPLLRSGLALAGINRVWQGGADIKGLDDGILTALEVANMDLFNTDLVVLSACETGRGDIDNNEGIMGLRRAFKTAGAKQLLISLWKVPDEQTSELMQLFYNEYINGKSAHQAFEDAQHNMRKRYKNPYYWAAFLLIE